MYQLLKHERKPEAVLCFNDYVATGALHMLHMAGIPVPDGMAVCGMDGNFLSEITFPTLTTIRFDYNAYADAIISFLLQNKSDTAERILIQTELVIQGST